MRRDDPSNSTSLDSPVALRIAPSFVLGLVKTILVVWLGFCSSYAAEEDPTQNTILVLGDSISAAYRIDTNLGWVSLLEKKLASEHGNRWRVVNASVSGYTTLDGLKDINGLLVDYEPQIMILELGANDGLRGYPVDEIRENLNDLIAMPQTRGSEVILAGMQIPPNYGPQYTEKFKALFFEVAKENKIGLIPFLMDNVAGTDEHMQEDLLHPTASGQPIMLNNVWAVLESYLSEDQTN